MISNTVTINNTKNNSELNEFLEFIKNDFTNEEQQLFINNFYYYLDYEDDEFIINLDDVYKWIGFTRKDSAKKLLEKHFIKDVDYIINNEEKPAPPASATGFETIESNVRNLGGAGLNKETILLTIDTFKELCIVAQTDKGKLLRKYYIKMEKCMNKYIKKQLQEKELIIKEQQLINDKKDEQLNKFLIPFEELPRDQIIYVFQQKFERTNVYKIGETINLKKRKSQYLTGSSHGLDFVFQYKTHNSQLLETILKHLLYKYKFGNEKISTGKEWYKCDLNHIKNIISITGACIDNIYCYRETITKAEIIKNIIRNIILTLFENDSEIETYIPHIINSTKNGLNKNNDKIKKNINKLIKKTNEVNHQEIKNIGEQVVTDITETINKSLVELMEEFYSEQHEKINGGKDEETIEKECFDIVKELFPDDKEFKIVL